MLSEGELLLMGALLLLQLPLEQIPQIGVLCGLLGGMHGLACIDPSSPPFGKVGKSTGVMACFDDKTAVEALPPLDSIENSKFAVLRLPDGIELRRGCAEATAADGPETGDVSPTGSIATTTS